MSDGFRDADKLRNSWTSNPSKSDHYQQRVNEALFQLQRAISIPGTNPDYHYEIMARHRREWPTLWAAIDNLLRL